MRFFRKEKRLKKRVEKLEKELDKLQEVVESLLDELGYKVGTTVYESDWNSYDVIKAEKKDEK